MDCSVREECVLRLHLLQEEKTEESNEERVVLLFFFFFSSQLLFACFKCCFEDLLLTIPILGSRDVECFLLILVVLNSAFVFPPGATGLGHSFFQTLSFPLGSKKSSSTGKVNGWGCCLHSLKPL